jgi:hypothetical protein
MIPERDQLWKSVQALLPQDFAPVGKNAINHVREIQSSLPNSSSVKVLLADLLMFSDDTTGSCSQEARSLLQEVINSDPFCVAAFESLAAVESQLNRDADAFLCARFSMELACNIETVVTAIEYGLHEESFADELIEMTDLASEVFESLRSRLQSIERQLGVRIIDSRKQSESD